MINAPPSASSSEVCGLVLYMLAALAVSISTVGAKAATNAGATVAAVIFFRCLIGAVIALAVCAYRGLDPLGHRRQLLVVRGAVGCFGIIGQVYASAFLPVALVSVFAISLQPMAAAAAAFFLLDERPPAAVLAALPISVVGIVLMLEPWRALAQSYRPDALGAAALSPICIGSAAAVVRKLSVPANDGGQAASSNAAAAPKPKAEDPQVVLMYLQFAAGGLALLAALSTDAASLVRISPAAALPILVCGLGGYLTQLFLTMALARARAAGAVSMDSLRVCFTASADWLLFGISMDEMNLIGTALVVAAAAGIVVFR